MNVGSFVLRGLVVTSLALVGQLRADVTVRFNATIDDSPFVTPGYTVGDAVTGWYSYDPASPYSEVMFNSTYYNLLGMHVLFGDREYQAGSVDLRIYHWLPQYVQNATDDYNVTGYSVNGPPVEGCDNGWTFLQMVDTDNSVYGSMTTPYPLAFPDPGLFELKHFTFQFLQGPPMINRTIHAWIDSIATIPEAVDSEPPTILSVTAFPNTLWPPNGKLVPVRISVVAKDNAGVTSTKILSVTSNEPTNDLRRGNTQPDWQIDGDLSLRLRAERWGEGSGRVYTIVVQCEDAAGNTSVAQTRVVVPHSLAEKNYSRTNKR